MNARALTETREQTGQVVALEGGSLMDVISRAAADPTVDVDKLERLLGMYERITDRQAEQAFNVSMSDAQAALRPVAADAANPQTKSRYASYAALDRAVRPIYAEHGFSLSFDTGDGAPADHIRLLCHVGHSAGYTRHYHVDMPADGKGAKGGDVMTKTHAAGAAMSYGQRYLLKLIFNIAVGEDKDGNAPPRSARDAGAGAQAAISAINACATLADLKTWKEKNAAVVDQMDDGDANLIVRTLNDRVRRLKDAGQ